MTLFGMGAAEWHGEEGGSSEILRYAIIIGGLGCKESCYLPIFYHIFIARVLIANSKGHVKQMIKRRVSSQYIDSTFVTDDVEACKFFFLLFQVVPHAHFSTLVIYEMATLAGNGTTQKISRQLIASMELYGYMDGRQAGTEQALFKPNQTRPALRSITMNEVSVLGISLSTQKVGVLQKNISPKQVTLT